MIEIGEDRWLELEAWDSAYRGATMQLTRAGLVELLVYDGDCAESGNYHEQAADLRLLARVVDELPAETPLGWFAWGVGELGPLRRCLISG